MCARINAGKGSVHIHHLFHMRLKLFDVHGIEHSCFAELHSVLRQLNILAWDNDWIVIAFFLGNLNGCSLVNQNCLVPYQKLLCCTNTNPPKCFCYIIILSNRNAVIKVLIRHRNKRICFYLFAFEINWVSELSGTWKKALVSEVAFFFQQ